MNFSPHLKRNQKYHEQHAKHVCKKYRILNLLCCWGLVNWDRCDWGGLREALHSSICPNLSGDRLTRPVRVTNSFTIGDKPLWISVDEEFLCSSVCPNLSGERLIRPVRVINCFTVGENIFGISRSWLDGIILSKQRFLLLQFKLIAKERKISILLSWRFWNQRLIQHEIYFSKIQKFMFSFFKLSK